MDGPHCGSAATTECSDRTALGFRLLMTASEGKKHSKRGSSCIASRLGADRTRPHGLVASQ